MQCLSFCDLFQLACALKLHPYCQKWQDFLPFYSWMLFHLNVLPYLPYPIHHHQALRLFLAIMEKAAMNSFTWELQISLWDGHFTSLEYKPGSYGSFISHFSGASVLFSIVAALTYILNKSAPYPSQHLLSPVFLMTAILTGMKWCLIMAWFAFPQGLVISSVQLLSHVRFFVTP